MLLAGDVGGTKTLLGLFERADGRPRKVAARAVATKADADLIDMVARFTRDAGAGAIEAACFGIAGPVLGTSAQLTNVPWRIDAERLAERCGIPRVALLNDLEAMAYGVPVLEGDEIHTLQAGTRRRGGNMAVIAAGTGLGQALLQFVDGRYVASPSEGGHADFAPRTEREIEVLRDLTARFGRASVEHVLSGRGLENLHKVTHREPCRAAGGGADAADISAAALDGACPGCVEALAIFVEVYGAEAGNLALRSLATGGIFVGGGIAPKILPALDDGRFVRAFRAKPPHVGLLTDVPVHVILNEDAALVGAAVYAGGAEDAEEAKDAEDAKDAEGAEGAEGTKDRKGRKGRT